MTLTTICASAHLARALTREDTRAHQTAGESLWESPDILSWNAWLRRQWDVLTANPPTDLPLLLDARQERLVWEHVIGEVKLPGTEHGQVMLDGQAAARLASAAHALVRAYRIPERGAMYQVSDDAQAFEAWQVAFLRICTREGWMPSSALADLLAPSEGELILAGFEALTPQQQDFLSRARIRERPMPGRNAQAQARMFTDGAEERRAAAQWAREIREREPDAAVAVFAFDLGRAREAWDEAFARDFGSEYSIGAGVPLASLPLAASALALLELLDGEISVAGAGAILLSPYVTGHAEERYARAWMDERLRKAGGPTIPLWHMAKHDLCPLFHARLQSWIADRKTIAEEQSPSGWARDFHRLLSHFGWPGDRRLNAAEFPVYEAWRDALSSFAALDRVQGAMNVWRARQLIESILKETLFDTAEAAATVHILPAPEALGAAYDHVWLAGAHDGVWPPPMELNPFLPVAMQRQYGVARATPGDVLRRARRWTLDLSACTRHLIVSAAVAEKKEPRRLSALFAQLDQSHIEPDEATWTTPDLEELADEKGPPPSEGSQRGGVRLFQFQAQCPFHAFAEFRLQAKELEEPHLGFDKRKQGTALHAALGHCWAELKDSATLTALGAEALREVITRAVDKVLTDEWRAETRLRAGMRDVERERLIEILERWLREERQRAPFKVLVHEQKAQVELGGLVVDVRTDRADELPDGRLVLIDYKAKAPSKGSWNGERITEPQLPLYAVTSDRAVAAVEFAQVQAKERYFTGAASTKGLFPGKRQDTLDERMLAHWREALENVAQEYREGVASVNWKKDACNFCKLPALCRKDELKQMAAGNDDGE